MTSAKEEPIHFSGRDLFVDYARRPTFTHKDEEPNKLVYFGRYDAGEEGLRNLLSEYEESIVTLSFRGCLFLFSVCLAFEPLILTQSC